MCCLEKISRAGVVSHTLIVGEELFIACSREMMDGRVFLEYSHEVSSYSFDLCLLEKYLRDPDAIGPHISVHAIVTPLEIVSSVFLIPIDEISPREWRKSYLHADDSIDFSSFIK